MRSWHAQLATIIAVVCLALSVATSVSAAKPERPLKCGKLLCDIPNPDACEVRISESCERGGGPPRCPLITLASEGNCDDGDACTVNDSCAGSLGCTGEPVICESPTATCEPTTHCATTCDESGCIVAATGDGDEDAFLVVPTGALSAASRITMVDFGPNPDPENSAVFRVYDLSPDGTQFAEPAQLDLPAPPLEAGEQVIIEVTDANSATGWRAVPTTLVGDRVQGEIGHFSLCRTRVLAPVLTSDVVMHDLVDFRDASSSLVPPVTCTPSSLFGVCFAVKNPDTATATVTDDITVRVFPWQCTNVERNQTDSNGNFIGDRCVGTVFPCRGPDFVELIVPVPAAGLAPGGVVWGQFDFQSSVFFGSGSGCMDGSFDIGVDIILREPTATDETAGMRSAEVGPLVSDGSGGSTQFQGIAPPPKQDSVTSQQVKDFLIGAQF